MIVHVHGGLHLQGHHPDVALAVSGRQGERQARVEFLVILPVVNLRLVENQLSAGLGKLPRPSRVLRPGYECR